MDFPFLRRNQSKLIISFYYIVHRIVIWNKFQNVLFAWQNFRSIMSNMKKSCRAALCNFFHKLKNFFAILFIKSMTRFIQNQDFWRFYSRTQNQNGTLFTVTQTSKSAVLPAFKTAQFQPFSSCGTFHISGSFIQTD